MEFYENRSKRPFIVFVWIGKRCELVSHQPYPPHPEPDERRAAQGRWVVADMMCRSSAGSAQRPGDFQRNSASVCRFGLSSKSSAS
jgi:hypothetical protein